MQYAEGMQYAVGVSAKRSTHTVDLANMGGGYRYFKCKKVKPMQWDTQYAVGTQYTIGMQYAVGIQYIVGMQYAVGTQYAVGVSAKRSTHTVDLANMGGGNLYL